MQTATMFTRVCHILFLVLLSNIFVSASPVKPFSEEVLVKRTTTYPSWPMGEALMTMAARSHTRVAGRHRRLTVHSARETEQHRLVPPRVVQERERAPIAAVVGIGPATKSNMTQTYEQCSLKSWRLIGQS